LRDGGSIINSTITNNTALENGGGYATEAGDLGAYRVRYFGNTIVANNQAGFDKDIHGVIHSLGNNLVRSRGASTGYIAADLPDGTDPKLGNLKNNGGQTDTRALLNTSPAINAGNNCLLPGNACVTGSDTDQRGFGFARKNGSAVDIGAYEFLLVAAPFPIGGRVFKSNGRGLGNALVTLTAEDGTTRTVEADAKGRFSFDNLEKGKSYVIKVENSLVEYEPQTIVVTEARDNVNLVPVATEAPAEFPQQ
jgi:hypothetical protein